MFDMSNRLASATDSELLVGAVALLALVLYALVLLLKKLSAGPLPPDPWDAETSAKLEDSDTPLLCHRCLVPNNPGADFCEQCGAPIGQYTNYLPFPYIFSLGHTLRLGTAGEYRRSPVTVFGFILLALGEYLVFAPIYLYQLFRKMPHKAQPQPTGP